MSNVYDAKKEETRYFTGHPSIINRSQCFLSQIIDIPTRPQTQAASLIMENKIPHGLSISVTLAPCLENQEKFVQFPRKNAFK